MHQWKKSTTIATCLRRYREKGESPLTSRKRRRWHLHRLAEVRAQSRESSSLLSRTRHRKTARRGWARRTARTCRRGRAASARDLPTWRALAFLLKHSAMSLRHRRGRGAQALASPMKRPQAATSPPRRCSHCAATRAVAPFSTWTRPRCEFPSASSPHTAHLPRLSLLAPAAARGQSRR